MKPYYQSDGATIYLGDVLEILPALQPAGSCFAFTDPPYNVGMIYGAGINDAKADKVFLAWSELWIELLRGHASTLAIYTPHKHMRHFWQILGDGFRQIVMNWTPLGPVREGMANQFASILTNYKPAGNKNNFPHVWTNLPSRRMGYAFHEPDYQHPGATSEGITRKVIGHLSSGFETVIDPFLGTGTTGVIAKERGLNSIGIEKSEAWAEIAAKRLDQTTRGFSLAGTIEGN